jgi:hypothetical protein
VRDAVTRHHTDNKPADKIARLGELTETYYFGHIKPSEREIREANEQACKHAEQTARAKVAGAHPPEEPERPSIYGKARLQNGQYLCCDPKCPRYRSYGGPVRDIVEWVWRRDNRFVSEPLEIDGKTIRGAQEYAVWDVVLSCGHFGQEHTKPGWRPEDGPVHRNSKKRRDVVVPLLQLLRCMPPAAQEWSSTPDLLASGARCVMPPSG